MKRKLISSILALTMIVGTIFTGCGKAETANVTVDNGNEQSDSERVSDAGNESASEDIAGGAPAAEADKSADDRPGAKWIDSGIYGTYEGMGEISLKDDFAAAINRDWAEGAKIREGAVNVSARTEQTDNYNEAKLAVLNGGKKDDQDLTSLQNYYALLTDWDTRNKDGRFSSFYGFLGRDTCCFLYQSQDNRTAGSLFQYAVYSECISAFGRTR